jgi:hypothetical protein
MRKLLDTIFTDIFALLLFSYAKQYTKLYAYFNAWSELHKSLHWTCCYASGIATAAGGIWRVKTGQGIAAN